MNQYLVGYIAVGVVYCLLSVRVELDSPELSLLHKLLLSLIYIWSAAFWLVIIVYDLLRWAIRRATQYGPSA